jgi:hypothetical protein
MWESPGNLATTTAICDVIALCMCIAAIKTFRAPSVTAHGLLLGQKWPGYCEYCPENGDEAKTGILEKRRTKYVTENFFRAAIIVVVFARKHQKTKDGRKCSHQEWVQCSCCVDRPQDERDGYQGFSDAGRPCRGRASHQYPDRNRLFGSRK